MKMVKSLIGGVALAASATAFATPVSVGGESPDLQTVINNLYLAATPDGSTLPQAPNVNTNQANEAGQFQIEASGGSVSTMVIEVAGNAGTNTFGIYDIFNPSNYLQLFGGPQSNGAQAFLSVTDTFVFSVNFGAGVQFASSSFGYYLGNANGPTFYSQSSLNGGNDQMVAFQGDGDTIKLPTRPAGQWGPSSYLLAWEDVSLSGPSDSDYQDMVVYVESVTAVPEPGTTALLGLAGLGLALSRRRKQVGGTAA